MVGPGLEDLGVDLELVPRRHQAGCLGVGFVQRVGVTINAVVGDADRGQRLRVGVCYPCMMVLSSGVLAKLPIGPFFFEGIHGTWPKIRP